MFHEGIFRIVSSGPRSHLRHIPGIHFLEMFHPDRETLSDVGRAVNVRLDKTSPVHLSMVSPIAVKRQRVMCTCRQEGLTRLVRLARSFTGKHVLMPVTPGALTTITGQCRERLGVTGDVSGATGVS